FLSSLFRLMGLDLKAPDHTTLSRRSATVEVPEFVRRGDQPIHLTIETVCP
ncbi:MAG: transposase, partial [Phycisphaerales bacterium]|nr:transposase [Phycisphaerales bacterium]